MKKSPLILMFFCTTLAWSPNTHAADEVWGAEVHQRHSNFDFNNYDATMASLDAADKEDQRKINEWYAALDNFRQNGASSQVPHERGPGHLSDRADEDESLMQKILAESVITANREQTQREFDAAKEETIRLNDRIGKLTEIVDERLAKKEEAWRVYISFTRSDPEIEALQDQEEKEKRLKVREEEKARAKETWEELDRLHAAAKADLKKLEAIEASANDQYLALSARLDFLKKQ